jgi:hypothetical protein
VSEVSSLGAGLPASVVVIGRCCSNWSLICSSNLDVLLLSAYERSALSMHAFHAVTMSLFNKG